MAIVVVESLAIVLNEAASRSSYVASSLLILKTVFDSNLLLNWCLIINNKACGTFQSSSKGNFTSPLVEPLHDLQVSMDC